MTSAGPVRVEVVEIERISGRGSVRTHWLVQQGDGWTRATAYAGAEVTKLQGGAGTVWERAITLQLPPGLVLERVESRPRPPPVLDPLAHLERGTKPAGIATRRTRFRVARDGRLVPMK